MGVGHGQEGEGHRGEAQKGGDGAAPEGGARAGEAGAGAAATPAPASAPGTLATTLMAGPGQASTAPLVVRDLPVPAVGDWIGRYAVRRIIGAGGNGVVVAAHDPELGRLVAIKLVTAADDETRMRLARE
ncbi:MAG TPA: hypothetical protein VKB80_24640, partial [Kofleriaceae bacterium]|nr:hypothetical protein [Kofleriaceae bacterium]